MASRRTLGSGWVGVLLVLLPLTPVYSAPGDPGNVSAPLLSIPEGGIGLILLPKGSKVRTLEFGGKRIALHGWKEGPGFKAALVGVDFAEKSGSLPLLFMAPGVAPVERSIRVVPRTFQVSRLHVARTFVTPPPSFLERLARERALIHRALTPPDEPLRFYRPFILPLSGRLTHDFGAYRYLNGHPMARHSGEDIDAPLGTPVRASNDGVVRLAGSFYYDGNMVIVAHGGGLLTEYLHLSDMTVKEGDRVRRGQILGHVGHTGRVTGPVLHYGAVLDGNHVNPLLLSTLLPVYHSMPDPFPVGGDRGR